MAFPGGSVVKNPTANAGDTGYVGLIVGSRRSPGEGNGNPLQYACLGNPMDKEAWQVQSVGSQRDRTEQTAVTTYHYIVAVILCTQCVS